MEKEIVGKFIKVFKALIENVKILCPKNSLINNNAALIDSFVNVNGDLIIRIYCAKVLPYENAFNQNPEEFLKNHDFTQDLRDIKEVPIDQIFVFKKLWDQLNKTNKDILINYVKGLNKIAHSYLDA